MGLKFRKSVKIAPGVKINLGKKGPSSLSIGRRGANVNLGKRGTKTTVGIPGSGVSYTTSQRKRKESRSRKAFIEIESIYEEDYPEIEDNEEPQRRSKSTVVVVAFLAVVLLAIAFKHH